MSSDPTSGDILDQYHNISNKLKKRFLRKPNVTEACEGFTTLGQQCENAEMPSYAGLCWIAAARCEGSLGNIPGETCCLLRSARQFLSAEVNDNRLGSPSPFQENLQAALNCYSYASSRLPGNSPLAIGLNLEVAGALDHLDKKESKEDYLKAAVDIAHNSLDTRIHCLGLLASDYFENGDYTAALDTFSDMANLLDNCPNNGSRSDVLLRCEISRVLLLLILRPTPQRLAPDLAKLLEKYTWGDQSDKSLIACRMSEKLFLLMQSLVMICQSLEINALPELESELWPYFSKEQKDLLRILVKTYLHL